MTGALVIATSDAHVASLIQDNPLVALEFTATWCGPCAVLLPVLTTLADDYPQVVVVKADETVSFGHATSYQVMGFPTVLFFRDGEVVDRMVGAKPKGAVAKYFDALVSA
ncbi:thioredoxin family protein [Candidatus Saccharibacteria bacterium]|nr:thioredoxin family protein [Candidatus Saccharibacteria bacterium]